MNKLHYYNLSLEEIEKIKTLDHKPSLLIHVCCGPCSAFPLTFLCPYFDVTIYYNNSNIYPSDEYYRRLNEMKRFVEQFNHDYGYDVKYIVCEYDEESYSKKLAIYKEVREGGERCFLCYRLRLEEGYKYAFEHNYDYFTTVMTISRQKNSYKLNEIGQELEQKYSKTRYFYSDFKKKAGIDQGQLLAKKYNLYQQLYCGCRYSYVKHLEK